MARIYVEDTEELIHHSEPEIDESNSTIHLSRANRIRGQTYERIEKNSTRKIAHKLTK